MEKRAQSATELIVLSAVLLVVFLAFMSVISTRNQVSFALSKQFYAQEVGYTVSGAINDVYISGSNTNKSVFIPGKLKNQIDYNITVSARILKIAYSGSEVGFTLVTNNISGTFIKGDWNQIVNNRGVIEIG